MRLSPLREHLRAATRTDHDRLDALFGRFDLRSRRDYVEFLTRHARALPPLEVALETGGVADLLADWPERCRATALRADLQALSAPEPPPVAVAPRFPSPAAVLGGLYVLEGSRLGARVLARQAEASFDPGVRAAVGYLRHGEARRFWPDFLAVLENHPAADDLAGLTEGARAAFRWFETAGSPAFAAE